MGKRTILIAAAAGLCITGLCVKSFVGDVNGRDVPVTENIAAKEDAAADNIYERPEAAAGRAGGEETQAEWEEKKTQAEQERKDKPALPETVILVKPIVKLNDEEGIWGFYWDDVCIRVDEETLLLVSDCYFPEKRLQQKIFFLAEAPDFELREVFRQDSQISDEELSYPEQLEMRMAFPHPVDGGYLYELCGVLYFLDKDFQEATALCDLHKLMGDLYRFSPGTYKICDVTADTASLLACMDDGLYEYDLENGGRRLLEPTLVTPHEYTEGDCACVPDYDFSGPVEAQYGPDDRSYAFATGTEEAYWGCITGVVLRSKEGETLYHKEEEFDPLEMEYTVYVEDFKWMELENEAYLAVFYSQYDEEMNRCFFMDRVDADTGEVMTFEVPAVNQGTGGNIAVGFLDEDTLLYYDFDQDKPDADIEYQSIYGIYSLSSGERREPERMEEADWELIVFDIGGFEAAPVWCPK